MTVKNSGPIMRSIRKPRDNNGPESSIMNGRPIRDCLSSTSAICILRTNFSWKGCLIVVIATRIAWGGRVDGGGDGGGGMPRDKVGDETGCGFDGRGFFDGRCKTDKFGEGLGILTKGDGRLKSFGSAEGYTICPKVRVGGTKGRSLRGC